MQTRTLQKVVFFLTLLRNELVKTFHSETTLLSAIFKTAKHTSLQNPCFNFCYGTRYFNINYTKISQHCILNCDLFRKNVIQSHSCTCGFSEDLYHFSFISTNYTLARNELFWWLLHYIQLSIIDCHLL